MGEVRYSVNGKYFKDFGIYVSDSDGLFDALKRKKVNTYDWAEYHGSSPDLSNPKFEAREINLAGFIVGENWEVMKSNFDAIISEFQKAGTQRLLIEPFGLKALPYEVYMDDSISLKKTFKNGKMVGTFSLKLIEPNPIKKVLYFTGDTLNLSYNSPNETEIFYGNGLKETAKGNVSLSGKTLANRVVSGYAFGGRNYAKESFIEKTYGSDNSSNLSLISANIYLLSIPTVVNETYTVSFKAKAGGFLNNVKFYLSGTEMIADVVVTGNYKYYSATFKAEISVSEINLYGVGIVSVSVKEFKLEKGNKATDWTPAPEEQKYIIIAGNIEEITNLTTNADVLWEKL